MPRSNLFVKKETKLFKIRSSTSLHLLFNFRIVFGFFSICLCINIDNNDCLHFHHFEITASFIQTWHKMLYCWLVVANCLGITSLECGNAHRSVMNYAKTKNVIQIPFFR